MTMTPDPLSAGLMTMSVRLMRFFSTFRSVLERLSVILVGCMFLMSLSILLMNVSKAGSKPRGGVQLLFFLYTVVVLLSEEP